MLKMEKRWASERIVRVDDEWARSGRMEESKKRAKLNAMVRNVNFVQSFNGSNVSELSNKFAFESTI